MVRANRFEQEIWQKQQQRSAKFRKSHMKTPVSGSQVNKVATLLI